MFCLLREYKTLKVVPCLRDLACTYLDLVLSELVLWCRVASEHFILSCFPHGWPAPSQPLYEWWSLDDCSLLYKKNERINLYAFMQRSHYKIYALRNLGLITSIVNWAKVIPSTIWMDKILESYKTMRFHFEYLELQVGSSMRKFVYLL